MEKKGDIIRVAGTMSGTSLDGVDIAVLETDGDGRLGFGETLHRPYSPEERAVLRAGLGTWQGDPAAQAASEVVETAHIEALQGVGDVDLIGFHGQTLAHDPNTHRTHQIGDGQQLADVLGVPVIWDFRSADMELGGQGAPLAPFFHWACAKHAGASAPIGVLNLGGVGNLTWVDPTTDHPDAEGALLAFDTGPGNALIDDVMQARGLGSFDEGGQLARQGAADTARVAAFLKHPYFFKIPPKSLDRNDFAPFLRSLDPLDAADAVATLAACTVMAVERSIEHTPHPPAEVWITGGGRHNAALMAGLKAALPCPVLPIEDRGFDGDALEAQAFAYLAARVVKGLTTSAPGTTGVSAPIGGGIRSDPRPIR